jgi:hypothetical protein
LADIAPAHAQDSAAGSAEGGFAVQSAFQHVSSAGEGGDACSEGAAILHERSAYLLGPAAASSAAGGEQSHAAADPPEKGPTEHPRREDVQALGTAGGNSARADAQRQAAGAQPDAASSVGGFQVQYACLGHAFLLGFTCRKGPDLRQCVLPPSRLSWRTAPPHAACCASCSGCRPCAGMGPRRSSR